MNNDFLKLLGALNISKVDYIIVGGVATTLHGFSRLTNIIDIWIKKSSENIERLMIALEQAGYRKPTGVEFNNDSGLLHFKIESGQYYNFFTSLRGMEAYSFEDCITPASIAEIDNLKIPFLHINHLIANKKVVNRPKDQIDVIELEKIVQLRKEMGLD